MRFFSKSTIKALCRPLVEREPSHTKPLPPAPWDMISIEGLRWLDEDDRRRNEPSPPPLFSRHEPSGVATLRSWAEQLAATPIVPFPKPIDRRASIDTDLSYDLYPGEPRLKGRLRKMVGRTLARKHNEWQQRRGEKLWKDAMHRDEVKPSHNEVWRTSKHPKFVFARWLVRKEERRLRRLDTQRSKEEHREHNYSVLSRRVQAAKEARACARSARTRAQKRASKRRSTPKVVTEREVSLAETAKHEQIAAQRDVDAGKPAKITVGGPSHWRPGQQDLLPTFPRINATSGSREMDNKPIATNLVPASVQPAPIATPSPNTADSPVTQAETPTESKQLVMLSKPNDLLPTFCSASNSEATMVLNALPRSWGRRVRIMTIHFPKLKDQEPVELRVSMTYDYKSEFMRDWRAQTLEEDLYPLVSPPGVELAETRLPFRSVASEGDLADKLQRDLPTLRKVRSAPQIPSGHITDVVADWTLPMKKYAGERYPSERLEVPPLSAAYPQPATAGNIGRRGFFSSSKPASVIHRPSTRVPATDKKSILKKDALRRRGLVPLAEQAGLVPRTTKSKDSVRFAGNVMIRQFRTTSCERCHTAKQSRMVVRIAQDLAKSDLSVDQVSKEIDNLFEDIEDMSPLAQDVNCPCEEDHIDDPSVRCYQRWTADYPGGMADAWREMEELDYALPPSWLDYASTPASFWDASIAEGQEISESDKWRSYCKNVLLPPISEADAEENCPCATDNLPPSTTSRHCHCTDDKVCKKCQISSGKHDSPTDESTPPLTSTTGSSSDSSPPSTPKPFFKKRPGYVQRPKEPPKAEWMSPAHAKLLALMEMEEEAKESGVDTTSSDS